MVKLVAALVLVTCVAAMLFGCSDDDSVVGVTDVVPAQLQPDLQLFWMPSEFGCLPLTHPVRRVVMDWANEANGHLAPFFGYLVVPYDVWAADTFDLDDTLQAWSGSTTSMGTFDCTISGGW